MGEERFGVISSKIYSIGSSKAMKKFYSLIANDVKGYGPRRILDVGAGPGDLSIIMSKIIKNSEVYCVDPSRSMLKIANEKFRKLNMRNINYKLGSSRDIPFKIKFDVILTSISFHHWKKKKESIAYLLSKLNKNGHLMIYEFYYDRLNFLQKITIGKHSLSLKEAKSYKFKGYKKNIEIKDKIIKVSFAK